VLEDTLDPRPQFDQFARRLAACAPAPDERCAVEDLLRGWNDRENIWANLRNIEHWTGRARS